MPVIQANEEDIREYNGNNDYKQATVFKRLKNSNYEGLTISMACKTCHLEEVVPDNHKLKDWTWNYTDQAYEKVDDCLVCHNDTRWIKQINKQGIPCLIEREDRISRIKSEKDRVDYKMSTNKFCRSCHLKEGIIEAAEQ